MGFVVEGVGSISKEISDICNFYGKSDATSVVVAKSILTGAYNFEQLDEEAMPYKRGNVPARRAEAVMIERALRVNANLITDISVRDLSKKILTHKMLEKIIAEYSREGKQTSLILRQLSIYLSKRRPDTRSGLVTFGERVINSRSDSRNPSMYIIPTDVDFAKLESHKVIPSVKKSYREFEKIRNIVDDLHK